MHPLLIALALAGFFASIRHAIYGRSALWECGWASMTLWFLVGRGIAVTVLNTGGSCRVCRIARTPRQLPLQARAFGALSAGLQDLLQLLRQCGLEHHPGELAPHPDVAGRRVETRLL